MKIIIKETQFSQRWRLLVLSMFMFTSMDTFSNNGYPYLEAIVKNFTTQRFLVTTFLILVILLSCWKYFSGTQKRQMYYGRFNLIDRILRFKRRNNTSK